MTGSVVIVRIVHDQGEREQSLDPEPRSGPSAQLRCEHRSPVATPRGDLGGPLGPASTSYLGAYSIQMTNSIRAAREHPEHDEGTPDGPLAGVRILALEQMQALPFATQLLARLGADVVKVEPLAGESGRGAMPSMGDPEGRPVGATFLRGNLNKRSICIDLKNPEGRDLALRLIPRFDVVAENSKPGVMERLGLSYPEIEAIHPGCIYASVSGFGKTLDSPYQSWMAYAPIVEAMSGIYEMKRMGDQPPTVSPVGALGDISAALFTTVGILAALRHRDHTGHGQQVDVAMFDAVLSMTDIVSNFWSMGLTGGATGPVINHGFRARDGWFVLQVGREEHFAKLASTVDHVDWLDDPRFATRQGWMDHLESDIRPAIENWASEMTRLEVCAALADAELAAGPCLRGEELASDPHVVSHRMLVGIDRPDGVQQPVLVVGNPVKLSKVPEPDDVRPPWVGEHTDRVLSLELGLDQAELADLHSRNVIA
jgi:crotonobetainyl-CoA:carnitine CoA-transferase CaiB-like acyl-CoA transferase